MPYLGLRLGLHTRFAHTMGEAVRHASTRLFGMLPLLLFVHRTSAATYSGGPNFVIFQRAFRNPLRRGLLGARRTPRQSWKSTAAPVEHSVHACSRRHTVLLGRRPDYSSWGTVPARPAPPRPAPPRPAPPRPAPPRPPRPAPPRPARPAPHAPPAPPRPAPPAHVHTRLYMRTHTHTAMPPGATPAAAETSFSGDELEHRCSCAARPSGTRISSWM